MAAAAQNQDLFSMIANALALVQDQKTVTSPTSNTNTRTVTTAGSQESIDAAVKRMLEGNQGLAAVASGQKTAGVYNSSTNQQLTNDLLSRVAAAAVENNKTVTTTDVGTTSGSTVKKEAPLPGKGTAQVLGTAQLVSMLANTGLGKKAIESGGDWLNSLFSDSVSGGATAAGTNLLAPEATDYVSIASGNEATGFDTTDVVGNLQNFFQNAFIDTATETTSEVATDLAADFASEAATSTVRDATEDELAMLAASEGETSFLDQIANFFSFAEGGRVGQAKKADTGFYNARTPSSRGSILVSTPAPFLDFEKKITPAASAATSAVPAQEDGYKDQSGSDEAAPSFQETTLGAAKGAGAIGGTLAGALLSLGTNMAAPGMQLGQLVSQVFSRSGAKTELSEMITNAIMSGNISSAVEFSALGEKAAQDYLSGLGLTAQGTYPGATGMASFTSKGQNLVGPASPGIGLGPQPSITSAPAPSVVDLDTLAALMAEEESLTGMQGNQGGGQAVDPGTPLGPEVTVTQNPDGSYTMTGGGGVSTTDTTTSSGGVEGPNSSNGPGDDPGGQGVGTDPGDSDFNSGGLIPGQPNGGADTVPIMATPGENVISVPVVNAMGQDFFDLMNSLFRKEIQSQPAVMMKKLGVA